MFALAMTAPLVRPDAASVPALARALPEPAGAPVWHRLLFEGHGTWTGDPTAFAYQWERCRPPAKGCRVIPGAIDARYRLRKADIGHTVVVRVTASNAIGASTPEVSINTSVIAATEGTPSPPAPQPGR